MDDVTPEKRPKKHVPLGRRLRRGAYRVAHAVLPAGARAAVRRAFPRRPEVERAPDPRKVEHAALRERKAAERAAKEERRRYKAEHSAAKAQRSRDAAAKPAATPDE